jgi:tetrahydromethanopterin S-methyltransferase subunit C
MKEMEKRPVSLTVIAWLLILLSALGVFGIATMGSNPQAMKMLDQMHLSLAVEQVWGALGAIVNIICAYGILKGLPWSRVLYVVWGVIGLVVGFYILPMKATLVVSLIILVVIAAFLWTNSANDWFSARGFMLRRERAR